ncbi:hypothetical protein [Streptomyces sp. NPDC005485]|uniref:hypothetical protein n=1 Tax=Streptomyces sp. NPDC005485 TaxID=3155591 RepID=UPI0033BD3D01
MSNGGSESNGQGFTPDRLRGQMAVDAQGEPIGEILDIYREPTHFVALLAKIRLPDRSVYAIPVATATPLDHGHGGIKVDVDRDALSGSPTLKHGDSVSVSPVRVEQIYLHHGVTLTFPKKPKAVRATNRSDVRAAGSRRKDYVTFPEEHLEALVTGKARPHMV